MSNAERPGSHYWALVEQVWIPLNESWSDNPQGFLSEIRDVPVRTGHLYAAHWCQSEICNGGLHQFFFNTTGLLGPEALAGFRAIGLDKWSAILDEAMQYFGSPYPRERGLRIELLPQPNGRHRAEWDPFFALDERFFAWLDAEADRWDRAADKYAQSGLTTEH